ncbi:hypothetical protein ACIHDR_08490 [Nocardia sp. NPDC052278]|uniref:hypothetical protein n=1 Tax=unclassified Nocardia TaxID=2637762 RepID=UPI003680BCE1
MSESVLPATTSLRIAEVDILPGFALLGILIVNVAVATLLWSFGGTADDPRLGFDGPSDCLVSAVTFSYGMGWLEPPSYWDGIQEVANPLMTFACIAGSSC